MSDKDISLRSAIFLIIGVLLVLSLIVCIYIINSEKDLKTVSARVIEVKNNVDGTGKNDVIVSYKVNNNSYEYNFYYKKDIKAGEMIDIYYHESNPIKVQTFKTSYIIFICPIIGLVLCLWGLIELFKKNKTGDKDEPDALFKTQVISVDGNTQRLEIITEDEDAIEYVKTLEEEEETPVKELSVKDNDTEEEPIPFEKSNKDVSAKEIIDEEEEEPIISEEDEEPDNEEILHNPFLDDEVEEDNEEEIPVIDLKKKVNIDDYLMSEVKQNVSPIKKSSEKVIPKYFYVTGTTLVYEVYGQEAKEIELKDIIEITRTINSEGTLIKVMVSTKDINCLLTNMNKVNLLEISNVLHNKMIDLKIDYDEIIEYKEF